MELSIGQPMNTVQSITPWTVNPSTGGLLSWWDVELQVLETDGSASPAWIYYDQATDEIIIDTALATTPGVYDFNLRGEALDDESNYQGKYEYKLFQVVIYQLSPSTVTNAIYPIGTTASFYQFDAFTCTNCADTATPYSITYTLEDLATGNDALTQFPAWLTSTYPLSNREIHYYTTDTS